jgi:adenylate kinase family enzyme
MQRVAIFGNSGGGKSTLARRLAELTDLPLHTVDMMQFGAGGVPVPQDEYLKAHAEVLCQDRWIIDGYGGFAPCWERLAKADTLIYVDLLLVRHAWWVTKRLLKGVLSDAPGWPQNSPVWSSTVSSYGVLWPCHRRLTPRYRLFIADAALAKRVHHLRSPAAIRAFLDVVKHDRADGQAGARHA